MVLGIDEALRRSDHVDVKGLDLANALLAVIFRARARDGDLDVAELRPELLRPGIACGRRRLDWLSARGLPPVPSMLAQRSRDRSVHRHRRVVPGAVAAAGGRPFAMLVAVAMLPRVPAVSRHVDPAAKGQPVVDHRNLVMVAGAGRMRPVQLEMDLLARRPPGEAKRRGPTSEQLDRAQVPLEDVYLKPGPVFRQPGQQRAQLHGGAVVGVIVEADSRIEIPADQQYLLLRAKHGLSGQPEIIGGVDDQARAASALYSPAIEAGLGDHDLG